MVIIPGINASTLKHAKEYFKKLKATGAPMIHLDIVDSDYADNKTWGSPDEFRLLRESGEWKSPDIEFEIHLMVEHPEFYVRSWFEAGAKRVVVQVETVDDIEVITDAAKEYHGKILLSAGPNIGIDALLAYKDEVSHFQILAVPPGPSGQRFDTKSLEKIKALRDSLSNVTIEVDGGITPDIARACKDAGADEAVSTSFILNAKDPSEAYEALQNATL